MIYDLGRQNKRLQSNHPNHIANANNPTGGFVINGEVAGDRSGHAVSSAGDINGDGLDDVRVSLPAPATNISSLWVPVSVLAFSSPK
jgi:hypothetical protein